MTVQLDLAFAALSDPTRRAIIARLGSGDATVKELAKPFAISLPAVSRHLRVLESANLVRQERERQFRRYRLNPEGLQTAAEWLDFYRRFWSESFERLDEHLKGTKSKGKTHGKIRANRRKS